MSEIAEFVNAGLAAQSPAHCSAAAQTAVDAAMRGSPPPEKGSENVPIVLHLTDDVMEMMSTMRSLLRTGCMPVSNVQSVKLQVALEQMGRAAYGLADELRRAKR